MPLLMWPAPSSRTLQWHRHRRPPARLLAVLTAAVVVSPTTAAAGVIATKMRRELRTRRAPMASEPSSSSPPSHDASASITSSSMRHYKSKMRPSSITISCSRPRRWIHASETNTTTMTLHRHHRHQLQPQRPPPRPPVYRHRAPPPLLPPLERVSKSPSIHWSAVASGSTRRFPCSSSEPDLRCHRLPLR